MFAVLAVASAAGICQRTTCDYSPNTNSQGAAYFRTTIYSTSHPDLENFRCGKASGSNDCECHCDPTYQCTLLFDADGDGPRETKSLHHCEPEPTEKAVPVLLQLKSQSTALQSEWAALTDQTTDSELAGLGLPGVTMEGSALTKLALWQKEITGPIPSFEANTALRELWLNRNKLTGPVPSLAANTALTDCYLQINQLSGTIPSFAANTALQRISLEANHLTGTIPSFAANTALHLFFLHHNQLTGTIPPDFSNKQDLVMLYLNDNQLTGTIPDFSNNQKLERLYLNDNQLTDAPGWKLNTANYPSGCSYLEV